MKLSSLSPFLAFGAASPLEEAAPKPLFLMHGYSVIIWPNMTDPTNPAAADKWTANFYSYATSHGYLSFGWWLPADNPTDHSGCKPNPSPNGFDWFEYSTGSCSATQCRTHCVNYSTKEAGKGKDYGPPYLDDDYVVQFADIGSGPEGKMHVGYFDKRGGGYAVGKMELLSLPVGGGGSAKSVRECNQAFQTLVGIQKERKLPLVFELENPCPKEVGNGNQVVMALEEL
jgi:hypothetical protein